jgi:hypothetical protein
MSEKNIRNPHLTFKKSMTWENEIAHFIASRLKGYSLNAPCGSSALGSVRLDIDPSLNPDKVGDINALPFENETFDSAVQDPLWKTNYYSRFRPFFELVRVVKVGGTLLYNAPWIPTSKAVRLEETFIRQSATFGNTSILSHFTKTTNQYDGKGGENEQKR